MGCMSPLLTWWSRVAAAVSGAALALVIPVHAWAASSGVGDAAVEAAKYRRRRGFGGFGFIPFVGGLCCLLVVAAIVLGIVLISRGRRRRPPS
jgi:hypothetical protein